MAKRRNSKKTQSDRFCWSCGFDRPRAAFAGKGHRRCLCRDCSTLSADELDYRQALLNIERLLRWDLPIIPRRKRREFERFLTHRNARVRQYAMQLLVEDRCERAMLRAIQAHDDRALEGMTAEIELRRSDAASVDARDGVELHGDCAVCGRADDCIPF